MDILSPVLPALLLIVLLLGAPPAADAKVFLSRQEALKAALPQADSVQAKDLFLTDAQKAQVERSSGARLDSALVTVYEGRAGVRLVGVAIFDTQVVRTQSQTLLVGLSVSGSVLASWMCAFNEPEEYLPTKKWFQQFAGKTASSELKVGRDVAGVAGSTLSSRAITTAVKRALAIHAVWAAAAGEGH